LIRGAFVPGCQTPVDDYLAGALANQTNLGIVGIQAMVAVYKRMSASSFSAIAKSANYSSIAASYVGQFLKLGGSSASGAHLTLDVSGSITALDYTLTIHGRSRTIQRRGAWRTTSGPTGT
jgi:hypothetical protein